VGIVVVGVVVVVAEVVRPPPPFLVVTGVVTSFSPSNPCRKFALFLLWVTPTATPTIIPTTTNIPTIMIAIPFVLRYHGIDFDVVTSSE
jgi:hypothetical protein